MSEPLPDDTMSECMVTLLPAPMEYFGCHMCGGAEEDTKGD